MDWHKTPLQDFFHVLETTVHGLSASEAASRLRKIGPNVLFTKRKVSPIVKSGKLSCVYKNSLGKRKYQNCGSRLNGCGQLVKALLLFY